MADAPTPAERTRTILTRCTSAEVSGSTTLAGPGPATAQDDWQPRTLTVSPRCCGPDAGVAVEVEVADAAPLPGRDRIRGRVRIVGTSDPEQAPGALHVYAARVALTEGASTLEIDLDALWDAEPDPLHEVEATMLGHLDRSHADVVALLTRLVPGRLLQGVTRVWPYRLDRHGLVLRLEHASGSTDHRLAFRSPLESPERLQTEVQLLVTRARARRPPCAWPIAPHGVGEVLRAAPAADRLCRPQPPDQPHDPA